jgi:hypothetical protein
MSLSWDKGPVFALGTIWAHIGHTLGTFIEFFHSGYSRVKANLHKNLSGSGLLKTKQRLDYKVDYYLSGILRAKKFKLAGSSYNIQPSGQPPLFFSPTIRSLNGVWIMFNVLFPSMIIQRGHGETLKCPMLIGFQHSSRKLNRKRKFWKDRGPSLSMLNFN